MSQTTRTLMTLLLTASLIFVAACGDSGTNNNNTTNNGTTAPGATDTQPAEDKGEGTTDSGAAASDELTTIEIELPIAQTVGTKPEQIASDADFDAPPPPPLQAPAGAVNLALDKPVTSSDPMPFMGDLSYITDGDAEAFDNNVVELAPGKQWVQIDLEAPCRLYGIATWRDHHHIVVYRDVVVQIADDADFTQNVRTVFNNDQDNSSGLGAGTDKEFFEKNHGHLVQLKGEVARYVRIYSNGNTSNDQNYYIEVAVYGVPQ